MMSQNQLLEDGPPNAENNAHVGAGAAMELDAWCGGIGGAGNPILRTGGENVLDLFGGKRIDADCV